MMRAGPSPSRSKAMVVPSFEVTFSMDSSDSSGIRNVTSLPVASLVPRSDGPGFRDGQALGGDHARELQVRLGQEPLHLLAAAPAAAAHRQQQQVVELPPLEIVARGENGLDDQHLAV